MIFENVEIIDPEGTYTGTVEIERGRIARIIPKEGTSKYLLMPGFVDIHTHAHKGIDVMHAGNKDLWRWAEANFEQGVTTFLPTTVSAPIEVLENLLASSGPLPPSVAGFHLEGPFINPTKKGAQNGQFIFPSAGKDLRRLLEYPVRIITAAPEIDGFEGLCARCCEKGIVLSIGHTSADYRTMQEAFQTGVRRITHFPNALTPLAHREIGATGAGLYLDFDIEMIVDGIHTSPEFVDLVYRIKGADHISLITDSIAAAGMHEGEYELGGLPVFVSGGKAVLADGTLAGSTLLFPQAVRNFVRFTGCSLPELAKVSSYNALKALKDEGCTGKIREGYRANLVLLDREMNLLQTIFEGDRVYTSE
ncbi:MAG TPA: N-acetylglucosamine-6-phosphate deacetylase [Thermotogota bacterium]|nr:N-acetylglucosamine-6-phosphate deacetylase [Thermotogota bacterium]HNT94981.1 N-acetylglucosamine-6-phosphate deacetylase [Thermotogota bacterium]HQN21421.1 N-acetylglucosamine-6-phosphate deacetylase [Thermotogota bacterium]HQQ65523.1 N-acetylglucosamine-6-phosphate deacetylase [Thermotogota bacterium]